MTTEKDINQLEEEELFEHHRIMVDRGQESIRIDKFLMGRLERTSRNRIQNAAKAGCLRVNDKVVKQNYKIRPNDVVTLVLPQPVRETEILPEDIPLDIVFEDDEVLVINKQAGLVVHPGVGNFTGTLVNGIVHHLGELPSKEGESARPGLVHRLDKDTSGLMVIAKTEEGMSHLAKQFFERSTERRYYALVWGDIEEDGTIEANIGRHGQHRQNMAVYPDGETGKRSVTHYKVIRRYGYVTLIECKLETGRTHQIRVHMQHLGHPLFGDTKYGGNRIVKGTIFSKYKQFVENCFKLLPRQALHAKTLGFVHPTTEEEMFFDSDIPADIQEVLDKWERYMNR